MNFLLTDNMKSEVKKMLLIVCISFLLLITAIIIGFTKVLIFSIISLVLFIYCVYGCFYLAKYKLEVTLDKIFISSLVCKKEINIADITSYKYQPYAKTIYYLFDIVVGQNVVSIKTKLWAEFDNILQNAGCKCIGSTIKSSAPIQNSQKWKKILAIVCAGFACLMLFFATVFPVLFKTKEYSATISSYKIEGYQVNIYTDEYEVALVFATSASFDSSKLDLLQKGKQITFDIAIASNIANSQDEIPIFSLYCDGECIFTDNTNDNMKTVSKEAWLYALLFACASVLLYLSYKQKWIFSK